MFPSATFCVFSNRVVAIIVAYIACMRVHGTVHSPVPLLSFTPCSLSNTVSSWAQYKALAYVSFGLQTLFKATKVIPVMIMGYFLRGTRHKTVEYMEALVITLGVVTFSYSNGGKGGKASHAVDAAAEAEAESAALQEWLGYLCLIAYVACDAFTSQWQSKLYEQHGKIDHWHMMFGINVSSVCLTVAAMVISGDIPAVWEFFQYNPAAIWFNIATSITSATGQIAIFYCIRKYGATIFTIIMTTRQVFSIMLSNLIFGHPTPWGAVVGATLVFAAVFYSSFRRIGKRAVSAGGVSAGAAKGRKGDAGGDFEMGNISSTGREAGSVEDGQSRQSLLNLGQSQSR